MDPVSNVDRLMLVLRHKLQERSKASALSSSKPKGEAGAAGVSRTGGIKALAGLGHVDERHLRRAVVQSLLADQFGANLINEAEFQQVLEQVTTAIEEDSGASRVLTNIINQIRLAG